MVCVTRTILGVFLGVSVNSRPYYPANLPNGDAVPCWDGATNCESICHGVGHNNCQGGSMPLNRFGSAFQDTGFQWTRGLCEADSDGDGRTNGEELGDPCCTWLQGTELHTIQGFTPSHPGFADSVQPEDYEKPSCVDIAPTTGLLASWNDGEEQKSVDFIIDNYELPVTETTYVNFRFNFDDESSDIFHIVYGIALVDKPRHLHHFVIRGCSEKVPENEVGKPRWWSECDMPVGGFAGWAPGAILWDMPPSSGVPIGKGVGIVGLNIEVHFTDADKVPGPIVSRDGIRVFYTPTLRPLQLSAIHNLNTVEDERVVIPAQAERFFITRTCTVRETLVDRDCFDNHADAINMASANGIEAGGCADVADLCESDDLFVREMVRTTCQKTCSACGDHAMDVVPPGYRHVADGYCCSEGIYVGHDLNLQVFPGPIQACADLCNKEETCIGFSHVRENNLCYWATYYPESAQVVKHDQVKLFVKEGISMVVKHEGGACEEDNWKASPFDTVQVCGECQVYGEYDLTCDEQCGFVGRTCDVAFATSAGCNDTFWSSIDCSAESLHKVCQCSEAITDEAVAAKFAQGVSTEPIGERPIVASFFHGHLMGSEMYAVRVRDGVATDMSSQEAWTFDYQATFPVESSVKSGDIITGLCVYNTMSRDHDTIIGLSTYDEMCQVTLGVTYPVGTNEMQRLYCDGGVIWTGHLGPEENARDILANHPWTEGEQIFNSDPSGGPTEDQQGLCSKYIDFVKASECSSPLEAWNDHGCDRLAAREVACGGTLLPQVDEECGVCKVQVTGVDMSCSGYCAKQGLKCAAAWDHGDDDLPCDEKEVALCDATFDGDFICECHGSSSGPMTWLMEKEEIRECSAALGDYVDCMTENGCRGNSQWREENEGISLLLGKIKRMSGNACRKLPVDIAKKLKAVQCHEV